MAIEWTAIKPTQRSVDLAVSFNQERRLLFEEWIRGLPGQTSRHLLPYNIPAAFRLTGILHTTALERAVIEVIRRHASLRAVFYPSRDISADDRPAGIKKHAETGIPPSGYYKQSVSELTPFTLRTVAVDSLPGGDEQRLAIIREEVEATFDYQQPPLIRAVLLKQEQDASLQRQADR